VVPAAVIEPDLVEDDAAILSDNLTLGANLGAGFAKWSPDSGETVRQRLARIVGGAMGYVSVRDSEVENGLVESVVALVVDQIVEVPPVLHLL
jgi:hypothetical protein